MALLWKTNGPASGHPEQDHFYLPYGGLLPHLEITVQNQKVKVPCPCGLYSIEGEPRASGEYTVEQLRSFGIVGYYEEAQAPTTTRPPQPPKVVHCKIAPAGSFIYVGRGQGSKWGNPFGHKKGTLAKYKVRTIKEAISSYEAWLETQPDLIAALPELAGHDLGCWCVIKGHEPCHARVLLRRANNKEGSP